MNRLPALVRACNKAGAFTAMPKMTMPRLIDEPLKCDRARLREGVVFEARNDEGSWITIEPETVKFS